MKEEETGEWRRGHHIVNICWSYMVVCIPFLVTTPQVFLWEPGLFLTCGIQVVLTSSHSEYCSLTCLQTTEMACEPSQVNKTNLKIFLELMEEICFVFF